MKSSVLAAAVITALAAFASAETAQFTSVQDNTLYESPLGGISSGTGPLFVGVTNGGELRRALIQFDLSNTVPAGATVSGVTLRINKDKNGPAGSGLVNLHRVLASWGEGTSSGSGGGGVATPGDATWTHRFHDTTPWTNVGGDFDPSVLASVTPGLGNTTISSTPGLVSAVQGWLAAPASNAGLMLKEGDTTAGTASRFLSRESFDPSTRPLLTVNFDRPVSSWAVDSTGAWGNGANWSGAVPASFGVIARFAGAISAPRTVSLASGFTAGQLAFDSANTYTLSGAGPLSLDNGNGFSARIDVASGSHIVSVPVISSRALTVAVNGSSGLQLSDLSTTNAVSKTGSGTVELGLLSAGSLDVQAGTAALVSSTAGLVSGLAVTGSGTIDFRHGGLIQSASPSSIDTEYAQRLLDIQQGRITAGSTLLIGNAKASDLPFVTSFMNRSVPASSILLRATFAGDSNLDGAVNFDDLLALAQKYGTLTGGRWIDGDSNRDGAVNFDDLLALAQGYGSSLVNGSIQIDSAMHDAFAGDWQRALSLTPEPVTALALIPLVGRRRR